MFSTEVEFTANHSNFYKRTSVFWHAETRFSPRKRYKLINVKGHHKGAPVDYNKINFFIIFLVSTLW